MSFSSPKPEPVEVTQRSTAEVPAFLKPFITGEGLEGALSGADPRGLLPRALSLSEGPISPGLPSGQDRLEPFTAGQEFGLNRLSARGLFGSPEGRAATGYAVNALGDPTENPLVRDAITRAQPPIAAGLIQLTMVATIFAI